MVILDWLRDEWDKFKESPRFPFKTENWKAPEDFFAAPKKDFWEVKTPAQAIRDFNRRQAGIPGNYYNSPKAPHDPASASRPTQRYLSQAGWDGAYRAPSQTAEGFGMSEMADLPQHTYSLTPWQMEQAELDYGIAPPKEQVELRSDRARTGRMSDEAFAALTPAQQNAVRFNQLLIGAVEADRLLDGPESQDAQFGYDRRVAEMFGTQGGSEMYAPNTLALLEELGMGQLRNQDLDEYLSLDRAYDVDEIRNLQSWEGPAPEYVNQGFGGSRTQEASLDLDRLQIEKAGALLEQARADTSLPGWDDMSRLNARLNAPLAPGWPTSFPTKEEVQNDDTVPMWNKLSSFYWEQFRDRGLDTNMVLDQFWADADSFGLSEQDIQLAFDDLYQRSYAMPEGDDAFMSGEELRAALGLEG